ncbi:MAG: type VI secretion system baseplate subunit TssK, partial [Planctomycetota bacterium]
MQFPPVHWHEGLFLQPQHFQAWDRHWTERVSMGEMWQNPYAYGVAEIEINSAALAAGYFQLDKLKAKTPAGTLLELSVGQQSERRDVRPALHGPASNGDGEAVSTSSRVKVYIGVPRLRLGDANVTQGEQRSGNRYSTE